MYSIEINDISKKYKDLLAVDGLSIKVNEGEFFSLLGLNGAGKTTTIKMLTGVLKPTSGDALLFGHSIVNDLESVKHLINVSPQETAVAPNLTVKENLEFIASIYGAPKDLIPNKVNNLLSELSLMDKKNVKAKNLSGGLQRRLSLGMALISDPKILFLDEPTLGLDVRARRELWSVISRLKGKTTIILTTHYLEEVEALSDRCAIMDKGKLKAVGNIAEIINQSGKSNFEDAFLELTSEQEVLQ